MTFKDIAQQVPCIENTLNISDYLYLGKCKS